MVKIDFGTNRNAAPPTPQMRAMRALVVAGKRSSSRETYCVAPVKTLVLLRRRSGGFVGGRRGGKVDAVEERLDDVGLGDGRDLSHLGAAIPAAESVDEQGARFILHLAQ